jgi:uncharacterized protein (DUF1919 family)
MIKLQAIKTLIKKHREKIKKQKKRLNWNNLYIQIKNQWLNWKQT